MHEEKNTNTRTAGSGMERALPHSRRCGVSARSQSRYPYIQDLAAEEAQGRLIHRLSRKGVGESSLSKGDEVREELYTARIRR
jgi:hypothetical protein